MFIPKRTSILGRSIEINKKQLFLLVEHLQPRWVSCLFSSNEPSGLHSVCFLDTIYCTFSAQMSFVLLLFKWTVWTAFVILAWYSLISSNLPRNKRFSLEGCRKSLQRGPTSLPFLFQLNSSSRRSWRQSGCANSFWRQKWCRCSISLTAGCQIFFTWYCVVMVPVFLKLEWAYLPLGLNAGAKKGMKKWTVVEALYPCSHKTFSYFSKWSISSICFVATKNWQYRRT